MKQVWFLQTPDLILRLRNISVTKTLVICDRVDLSRLRSICFAARWIKATVQQQMVLTAALGSIRRCCRTLASSQRPDTHRLSNSHSSLPNTLASAHTPPTAPEHTKPSGVKEFFFFFTFHFIFWLVLQWDHYLIFQTYFFLVTSFILILQEIKTTCLDKNKWMEELPCWVRCHMFVLFSKENSKETEQQWTLCRERKSSLWFPFVQSIRWISPPDMF